jgi:hypothetical protein
MTACPAVHRPRSLEDLVERDEDRDGGRPAPRGAGLRVSAVADLPTR